MSNRWLVRSQKKVVEKKSGGTATLAAVCKVQYLYNGNFIDILFSPRDDFEIHFFSARQQILNKKTYLCHALFLIPY